MNNDNNDDDDDNYDDDNNDDNDDDDDLKTGTTLIALSGRSILNNLRIET